VPVRRRPGTEVWNRQRTDFGARLERHAVVAVVPLLSLGLKTIPARLDDASPARRADAWPHSATAVSRGTSPATVRVTLRRTIITQPMRCTLKVRVKQS
jgi:hypothetical protein